MLADALIEYPKSFDLRRLYAAFQMQDAATSASSESLFRDLLRERPDDEGAAFTLADLLISQHRTAAAANVLQSCFGSGDHEPDTAIRAMELLDDNGRTVEAAAIAEYAIASHPEDARLHAYAGLFALHLGQFDRSRERYAYALLHDTRACEWHVPHGLAQTQKYRDLNHPDVALFERCLSRSDLSEKARSTLLFALGKIHDDVGDYACAAGYYREGNSMAQRLSEWSGKAWRRVIASRLAAKPFTAICALENFVPIFIVGMPRSGTTLAAELLARNPGIRNRGEPPWISQIVRELEVAGSNKTSALEAARNRYVALARQDDAPNDIGFIDKQPLNFRYIDLILTLFPNAKIIHCQRAPRDTALSLWTQSFTESDQGYAWSFDHIALVMRDEQRLMAHWRSLWPHSIHTLHYETLVSNPQACTAEILEWIGIGTKESAAVNPNETSPLHSIPTASMWQVRQPVHMRSIERWRHYAPYVPELAKFPEK